MARYNEILVGRYNRFVQKLFQMKGRASLAQLDDTLVMAMQFFSGAEHRYLEQWNKFGLSVSVGAVAGVFSTIGLRNPATSNVVAVIEKALIVASTGTAFLGLLNLVRGASADAGGVVNVASLDARAKGNSSLNFSGGTTGMGGTSTTIAQVQIQGNASAGSSYDFLGTDIQEIPLLPGDAFNLQAGAVNIGIGGAFWWRERFLEEAERT